MQTALSSISTSRTSSTINDIRTRIQHFLDYAWTHPNATLKYVASDMHLWAHSDASYLCEPKGRSRAGGFVYLSSKPQLPLAPNSPPPPSNAAIHIVCKVIDTVMSSAQEAETGAGFVTAKDLVPIRQTLEEMGHPQGPTPLQFDNKCATGIINDNVKQKMSKAMDMRFYWLRDRVRQKQFHVHWKPGTTNLADYVTKHHPTKHHQSVRPLYVSNSVTTPSLVPMPSHKNKNFYDTTYCKGVLLSYKPSVVQHKKGNTARWNYINSSAQKHGPTAICQRPYKNHTLGGLLIRRHIFARSNSKLSQSITNS